MENRSAKPKIFTFPTNIAEAGSVGRILCSMLGPAPASLAMNSEMRLRFLKDGPRSLPRSQSYGMSRLRLEPNSEPDLDWPQSSEWLWEMVLSVAAFS